MMIGGIFRDKNKACDPRRRVGMLLKRRIPEILRKMLLAHCKAGSGCPGITGKHQ